MNALARTLVYERKRRGLTQAEAAKSLGISRSYLIYFEKGQQPTTSSHTLDRLATFYGLDVKRLKKATKPEREAKPKLKLTSAEKALIGAVRADNASRSVRLATSLVRGKEVSGNKTAFAPLLLAARKEKGMTQQEVATLTGIPRVYISRIELGGSEPSTERLKKLATVYGLNVDKLLQMQVDYEGITSLSESEQILIDAVRAKDANKAFDVIDELIPS